MTTRLQLAQELFGYDPEVTPAKQINRAESELDWALGQCDHLHDHIDRLEDDAIYAFECDCGYVEEQEITGTTATTITVTSRYAGDRQEQLPRQPLEAGAVVSPGTEEWESE